LAQFSTRMADAQPVENDTASNPMERIIE
jgi:hypothetical protein